MLRAVQAVLAEGMARPLLVGRPAVIEQRIERAGLRLKPGADFEVINPDDDPRFRACWEHYHRLMGRDGVSPEAAKAAVRRSTTLISALLLQLGEADAMLCGLHGRYDTHFDHVSAVIGQRPGATGRAGTWLRRRRAGRWQVCAGPCRDRSSLAARAAI